MMKIRFILATAAILVAMMFAVNGCGGGGGGSSSTPPTSNTPADDAGDTGDAVIVTDDPSTPVSDEEKVTKLIKADSGGTVSLESGISLYIPPNALNKDTNISLSSVDISQFDGDMVVDDEVVEAGVNGLHITGAVLEPDGTVLNIPVVVRFPLEKEWVNDKALDLYAAKGNDPLNVLPSGEEVTVTGTPGAYVAEVRLSHFTVILPSYNCHSGTFRNIQDEFKKRGCTEEQIKAMVEFYYPGFKIDDKQAENMDTDNMQAFLGTYFYNRRPYNEDEDISVEDIAFLEEYINNGRQVVIAFNLSNSKHKTIWPEKGKDGFYEHVAHTANLEIDDDGIVQMRHTLAWDPTNYKTDSIHGRYQGLIYQLYWEDTNKAPTLSYTYPLKDINKFRKKKRLEGFKEYVQKHYPNTIPEANFRIPDDAPSYNTVNIYIEKSEGLSQNPCAEANCEQAKEKYSELQKNYIDDARVANCEDVAYSGCWWDIAEPLSHLRAEVIFSSSACSTYPPDYALCAGALFKPYISCLEGCNKEWMERTVFNPKGIIGTCVTKCSEIFEAGLPACRD